MTGGDELPVAEPRLLKGGQAGTCTTQCGGPSLAAQADSPGLLLAEWKLRYRARTGTRPRAGWAGAWGKAVFGSPSLL